MRFITILTCSFFLLTFYVEASTHSKEAELHYQRAVKLSQQKLWKDAIPEFIKAAKLLPNKGLIYFIVDRLFVKTTLPSGTFS